MLSAKVLNLFLFWGIWLLVPLIVDGFSAIGQLVSIALGGRTQRKRLVADLAEAGFVPTGRWSRPSLEGALPPLERYPLVTVIIPIHNGSHTLGRALESLAKQTYPGSSLEIICVDNGSTDHCFGVFSAFQAANPGLRLSWVPVERPGKAAALNAGIYLSAGDYFAAVDADVSLAPDAIYEMIRHFEYRPRLVAATGVIAVAPPKRKENRLLEILHVCEAFEYFSAFRVGRRYQSLINALYTLSGAFSVFRRGVLLESSYLYDSLTVSEDTKLTFDLRDRMGQRRTDARLECIDTALAFVEPIASLQALYSQRLRWQRGQVEVAALHLDEQAGVTGPLRTISGRILLADHTLAFPRLVWTFLLPFLFLLGYSPYVVALALFAMYISYMLIESLFYLSAYGHAGRDDQRWLRHIWWVVIAMPLFRFMVYWFRLAGILHAVAEPQRWHTLPFSAAHAGEPAQAPAAAEAAAASEGRSASRA